LIRVLYTYSWTHIDTGSPKALISMAEALDKTRFEVFFLAPSEGPLCAELRKRGVTVVAGTTRPVNPRHPGRDFARIIAFCRLLKKLRIDIVHINEFGWNLDLAFAARLAGCGLVLHFHNPGGVHRRNLHWILASRVILVSEGQKQTIAGFDRIRAKSVVVHNAIDLHSFGKGISSRPALGLPEDAVVIGTIAQICHRKGIDLLLETANEVVAQEPRAFFVVAGPDAVSEEGFANTQRERASVGPLAGHVRFLGSRSDIPNVLASMDIFFMPTRAEPFGLVIIEAMAAGLPVVASRVGGIPEIIRNNAEGLLIEPGNCPAYATALLALVRDKSSRMRIGATGRAGLKGRFDSNSLGTRLSVVYAEAIGCDH
jgi:glycosyltransferase involved in cell wall biosynthesis